MAAVLTINDVMQKLLDNETPRKKMEKIIRSDSGAARRMPHRVGCGQVRHTATLHLWHQEALRNGQCEVERVSTKDNAADLDTKTLDLDAMTRGMNKLSIKS